MTIRNNEIRNNALVSLSGGLLSNFYLSYYTFMFFIGSFFTVWYRYWISIRNRDTNLNFWPDSLFLLLIQEEPGLREKEKKKDFDKCAHRTENLLGILFLVFSF